MERSPQWSTRSSERSAGRGAGREACPCVSERMRMRVLTVLRVCEVGEEGEVSGFRPGGVEVKSRPCGFGRRGFLMADIFFVVGWI